MKKFTQNKAFVFIFALMFFSALFSSFYKYYYTKDYDYAVEASCDPALEKCFSRDCSNADDCPPNGLSVYKVWHIKAYDFPKCSDNSCKKECEEKTLQCEPIVCDAEAGDECVGE